MWPGDGFAFLDLHSGAFLLSYALFAGLTLSISYLVLKSSDRTSVSSLPLIPSDPDPIEIAYLAGGEHNVIRVVLYDMIQRGLVEVDADSRLRPTQASAHPDKLTNLEEHILGAVQFNPGTRDIYENALLRSAVRNACDPFRAWLEAQQLLPPRTSAQLEKRILQIGLSALVGVALLKVLLACLQGRKNVGFLVLLMVVASVGLLVVVAVAKSNRLSKRGNAWLAQLRLTYSSAKTEAVARHVNVSGEPQRSASAFDGAGLFLIGLYGFEILLGTADEHIAQLFKRGADASVSACGASGCGGGGCGGGCGG